jgi:hypothetical protein
VITEQGIQASAPENVAFFSAFLAEINFYRQPEKNCLEQHASVYPGIQTPVALPAFTGLFFVSVRIHEGVLKKWFK